MRIRRYDCRRCSGMMVETYSELLSPRDKGEESLVWRCVNCGEYVDRLVLLNRGIQQGTAPPPLQLMRRPTAHRRSRPVTIRQHHVVA